MVVKLCYWVCEVFFCFLFWVVVVLGGGLRRGVPHVFLGGVGVPPRVVLKQWYHSLLSKLVKYIPTIFCSRRREIALINLVKR